MSNYEVASYGSIDELLRNTSIRFSLIRDDGSVIGDLSKAEADLFAAAEDTLTALKLARQYVAATHAALAGAVGPDNLVSPDLAAIDAAIARSEGKES